MPDETKMRKTRPVRRGLLVFSIFRFSHINAFRMCSMKLFLCLFIQCGGVRDCILMEMVQVPYKLLVIL